MIGLASLVGAVLGIYFRNAIDTDQAFRRSALIGVRGALMIGYVFAGTRAPGDPPALGVGLSAALLTFCLFTPAAIRAFRARGDRGTVRPALTLGAIGLAAGSPGAAVGALIG